MHEITGDVTRNKDKKKQCSRKVEKEKILPARQRILIILYITWETEEENQALAGAIPYCDEYPGPRFEDKFRSANQMDGITKAGEIKWLPVTL